MSMINDGRTIFQVVQNCAWVRDGKRFLSVCNTSEMTLNADDACVHEECMQITTRKSVKWPGRNISGWCGQSNAD